MPLAFIRRATAGEGLWDRAKSIAQSQYPDVRAGTAQFYRLAMAVWKRMCQAPEKAIAGARFIVKASKGQSQFPMSGSGVGSIKNNPRNQLVLKARVRQYTRTSSTGQQVVVREHDDKRTAARPQQPAGRRPGFSVDNTGKIRWATLHTAGPGSPGHAFRMTPHSERPGAWQVHEADRPQFKQSMQQPGGGNTSQHSARAVVPQQGEPKTPPPPGRFHAPGQLSGEGMVARSSRAGVLAAATPPPPAIPRLPNLAPDERAAEEAFADAYERDPEGMVSAFLDGMKAGTIGDAPNIFATDEAKKLSGDWNPSAATPDEKKVAKALYNTAVHQAANAIAKRAFVKYLDEVVAKASGDQKSVLVTAGGVAAGKGYALENIGATNKLSKMVGAVWDSAGEQNSTECPWVLDECRKRGIKATFVYVHANPLQTWENPDRGVVERASKKGRMVDARVFADSYSHGAHNFANFAATLKGDSGAEVYFIDNTQGNPQLLTEMPAEALSVDPEALYQRSLAYLQKASVAPHIKRGGSSGARIWGPPKAGLDHVGAQRARSADARQPARQ